MNVISPSTVGVVLSFIALINFSYGQDSEHTQGHDADHESVKQLFDGKTLKGWSGDEKFWSVSDGAITGQTTADNPTSGNTFLIWQGGDIDDFELRLKFKIEAGNSGIQFRSRDLGEFRVGGYQADIDFGNTYTGIIYDERGGRGILCPRAKSILVAEDGKKSERKPTCDEQELLKSVKKGDWNEYVIKAEGDHITQSINGYVTAELTDWQKDKAASKGILALQLHAGPPMKVQFKDIRLKQLHKHNGDH